MGFDSPAQIKPEHRSCRYWVRLAAAAVGASILGGLCLLIGLIYIQLEAFLVPHRATEVGTPEELNRPYRDVTLTTSDGLKIAGWYVPGTRPQAIILVHGIHANRRAVLPEARILAEAGYHLLMIDLRGHGQSEGRQNSYGYREALDVQAAVDYLDALPDVDKIGVLGASLGGATVVRAAAIDERIAAVVIESSYSSLSAAIDDGFDNLSFFPKWPFALLFVSLAERRLGVKAAQIDSARDLATFKPRPVLIIHGLDDQLFPPDHAERMFASAQEPKELWLIEGLGHANPVPGHEAEYRERVVGFFEKAFKE
ncbi:MAG: alpha/beta fold hydrolase [Anaerolineaceae bacterium]|nr:alpha/beta fold hydrolase [Anaerolineaceae bacterium]